MKRFFMAFIWFLLLAFIALLFHHFVGEKLCGVCQTDKLNKADKEQINAKNADNSQKLTAFSITDGTGKTIFKFPSNFVINSLNGEVEIPETMLGFKDSIFDFLNKNQGKELLISAKYLKGEGEPRGIDRANFLKNLLVKGAGINPHRIIPKAVLSDYSFDSSNKYSDGIAMLFRNTSEKAQAELEKSISNKTLYTKFGSVEFKADRKLQTYAFELKNYLKKYSDKRVTITGHTDDVGAASGNYKLGLKRANNVLNYLISQGIDKSRIKAVSKGETLPIASNTTEEGRTQNRRITIVVN